MLYLRGTDLHHLAADLHLAGVVVPDPLGAHGPLWPLGVHRGLCPVSLVHKTLVEGYPAVMTDEPSPEIVEYDDHRPCSSLLGPSKRYRLIASTGNKLLRAIEDAKKSQGTQIAIFEDMEGMLSHEEYPGNLPDQEILACPIRGSKAIPRAIITTDDAYDPLRQPMHYYKRLDALRDRITGVVQVAYYVETWRE